MRPLPAKIDTLTLALHALAIALIWSVSGLAHPGWFDAPALVWAMRMMLIALSTICLYRLQNYHFEHFKKMGVHYRHISYLSFMSLFCLILALPILSDQVSFQVRWNASSEESTSKTIHSVSEIHTHNSIKTSSSEVPAQNWQELRKFKHFSSIVDFQHAQNEKAKTAHPLKKH